MRKPHTSKNAAAPPELPKQAPAAIAIKDADKRKSGNAFLIVFVWIIFYNHLFLLVSFGQPPPAQLAVADMSEHALQKETILEKLRKFFRSRPSVETLKERGIYKGK